MLQWKLSAKRCARLQTTCFPARFRLGAQPFSCISVMERTSALVFGLAGTSASCPASPRNGAWEAV